MSNIQNIHTFAERASMPDDLKKAHFDNDKAVMSVYGFTGMSDEEITKALLHLYKEMTKNE